MQDELEDLIRELNASAGAAAPDTPTDAPGGASKTPLAPRDADIARSPDTGLFTVQN